jgi:hypothetical protein
MIQTERRKQAENKSILEPPAGEKCSGGIFPV